MRCPLQALELSQKPVLQSPRRITSFLWYVATVESFCKMQYDRDELAKHIMMGVKIQQTYCTFIDSNSVNIECAITMHPLNAHAIHVKYAEYFIASVLKNW